MTNRFRVSVIVPAAADGPWARECLGAVGRLAGDATLETFLVTDHGATSLPEGCMSLAAGSLASPGAKRDLAAALATGDFLAFLDDDAMPAPDWLERALPHFEDPNVAAVCGPAITPPDDPPAAQEGGLVLESALGSGALGFRYRPATPRDVDDAPSCNLIVRRTDFEAVGGFSTDAWPGEDTALCEALTHGLGKRIVYDPAVRVFHHRRPLYRAHLKQQGRYGRNRGALLRRQGVTSRRPLFLAPALLVLGVALGPLIWRWPGTRGLWQATVALYALLCGAQACALRGRGLTWRSVGRVEAGIALTHVWYGIQLWRGFLLGPNGGGDAADFRRAPRSDEAA